MHDLRRNNILSFNKPRRTSYGVSSFSYGSAKLRCSYSEIRDEINFRHVFMLPLEGRVRTLCNL